jgi:hypothetical protein
VRDKQGACWVALLDAPRDRHSQFGHPVDHGAGDLCLGLLRHKRRSPQRGTNQNLVAKQRRFHERPLAITHRFVSSSPPFLPDELNMLAAWTWHRIRSRARPSGRAGWHNGRRRQLWLAFGDGAVDGERKVPGANAHWGTP